MQTRAAVVEFMPYSFALVNKASARFLTTERRYNYTTPKTFLELIKLYTNVLTKKREQTNTNIDRLETGLTKLHKTQKDVDVLVEAAQRMAIQVRCFSGCSPVVPFSELQRTLLRQHGRKSWSLAFRKAANTPQHFQACILFSSPCIER